MDNLRKEVGAYLESMLGASVQTRISLLKLPFHIKDAYQPVEVRLGLGSLADLELLLLVPRESRYPGVIALNKHLDQIRKATDATIVLAFASLSAHERRSLIGHRINFIQPRYQMFIPEIAIDLRERFRQRKPVLSEAALLPATQAVLLQSLYGGWASHDVFSSVDILGEYTYSRVTLGKVLEQLQALGLLVPVADRVNINRYEFKASAPEIFSQARQYFRSPVKRRVFIDSTLQLGNGVFLAGEAALAEYTLLAAPGRPVYGMTRKVFSRLEGEVFRVTEDVDQIRAEVEVWSYAGLPNEANLADKASLLLSLEENPDERIQMALDEIRESIHWLSGD
ncbi:hypothetical protein [Pseudomonas sp. HLMP]|uniref:hypothetical protein n=1 Tax=Pseudomonas sp. HLMP TaxID=3153767 RepID=UPI003967D69A